MSIDTLGAVPAPDYDPTIQGVKTLPDEAAETLSAQLDVWSEVGER